MGNIVDALNIIYKICDVIHKFFTKIMEMLPSLLIFLPYNVKIPSPLNAVKGGEK